MSRQILHLWVIHSECIPTQFLLLSNSEPKTRTQISSRGLPCSSPSASLSSAHSSRCRPPPPPRRPLPHGLPPAVPPRAAVGSLPAPRRREGAVPLRLAPPASSPPPTEHSAAALRLPTAARDPGQPRRRRPASRGGRGDLEVAVAAGGWRGDLEVDLDSVERTGAPATLPRGCSRAFPGGRRT